MNIRGIDISSGNVEDILAVLDILVADLSNVKDQIKELKSFESESLTQTKQKIEEIQNEVFNLLSSSQVLYKKIEELNKNIDTKKSNFEEEVTNLIENTLKQVKNDLVYINSSLKSALDNISKAPDEVKNSYGKLINKFENAVNFSENRLKKTINNVENDLKSSVTKVEETSKNAIEDIKKYIEQTKTEIDQKTFLHRWGAVFIAFGIGAIITIAVLFYFFKYDVIFSLKYSDTCYKKGKPYKCYAVPVNLGNVLISDNNKYYLIKK